MSGISVKSNVVTARARAKIFLCASKKLRKPILACRAISSIAELLRRRMLVGTREAWRGAAGGAEAKYEMLAIIYLSPAYHLAFSMLRVMSSIPENCINIAASAKW